MRSAWPFACWRKHGRWIAELENGNGSVETVHTVRQPFTYKLEPTASQERTLELVLSRWQQEAQLKAIRAELPEYADIHSHVLQDVLARLDRACHACFRRVQAGEK